MLYKILTDEEVEELRRLKSIYVGASETEYNRVVERYLDSIGYSDRLAAYLENKWYIRLIKFFQNLKKK